MDLIGCCRESVTEHRTYDNVLNFTQVAPSSMVQLLDLDHVQLFNPRSSVITASTFMCLNNGFVTNDSMTDIDLNQHGCPYCSDLHVWRELFCFPADHVTALWMNCGGWFALMCSVHLLIHAAVFGLFALMLCWLWGLF